MAETLGCTPAGLVEVVPEDKEFDFFFDVADVVEAVRVDAARHAELTAGEVVGARAVRAGYRHPKFGVVTVQYQPRQNGDRHPISLELGAGPLGIPVDLWSKSTRRRAYGVAEWIREVLKALAGESGVLYGGIGIENALPTPDELGRTGELPTELFVSHSVLGRGGALADDLRREFEQGESASWATGRFFSAWEPFNSRRVSISMNGERMTRLERLLKAALTDHG
ncbi:hypothetical protein [Saccharothrix sp. NRRL B-16348]|uniref:hypothetical protein n=1 Tax=Saccharothrix sp. NRRL B-16348 TaxID=1415542 RepID=UPI0012F9CCE1|nr:hypothetical protein [Saccharothrix sp. NRRL B-16348]